MPTLLRWMGYLCLALATIPVGFSVWAAVQQSVWGAFSFVSAFVPAVAGVALLGLARVADDVAALRRLAEAWHDVPAPPPGT